MTNSTPCFSAKITDFWRHSTGKERDAETGLDYFGARYYSGAQGRFTSPDPIMASARTSIPQSFNRYSYALNNPLKFVDPTGMYVCGGTDEECKKFDKTLRGILSNKESTAEQIRAAESYGALGDDNGIQVRFVDSLHNNWGGEVNKMELGYEQDPQNPSSYRASLMVSIARSQIGSEETVSHEGSHVADRQDFVRSLSTDLKGWDDSLNITNRQSEMRAWQLSISLQVNGNARPNYGSCGVDECKFTKSILPATRDRLINQLLDDPRNGYRGMDLKIYPEFQKPQK